jgi:cyanophycinase
MHKRGKTSKKANTSTDAAKGVLLFIGGHETKSDSETKRRPDNFTGVDILTAFVKLIGKRNPVIEVITSASTIGTESFEVYRRVFNQLGVTKIGHIHHTIRQEVLDDDLEQRVHAADAFFFTGGDQLLLTSLYGGSVFLKLLKYRYVSEKIVIGGTSAGAMALSTTMIYAGNRYVQQLAGEVKVTTGLSLMKDVCIDTHFVHRGRFVRLAQVVATNPTCLGIGIEEDTAIIVRHSKEIEVIGSGTIIFIEGNCIAETDIEKFGEKQPVTIRHLVVHILSNGDKYEIKEYDPQHI